MIEFPGLSLHPDGFTKVFVVRDAGAVEKWVDQTFFVEPIQEADAIIANSEPVDYPNLFYLPSTSELVFLSQHWRTDAIGICMLLDHFFSILAQPQDQISPLGKPDLERISPSLEDAAGSPENAPPELQHYAREYIDNFHKKAVNTGGLSYKGDSSTLPAGTSHQDLTLTKESTSALVAACKSRSISVSAAIHTALAHTMLSLAPPAEQSTDYTTVMAVNMRKYLTPPYNTKMHACQTYVASITPTVKRSSGFSDCAVALTREYKDWYDKRFIQALRPIYQYHEQKLFAPRPQGVPPPKPPSGVTLSSLGRIEEHLTGDYGETVHVDGFRFGVSMMTRQTLLYAWTFRGQLSLSIDFNRAYYDSDMVQEVLLRIRATLERELGLEIGEILP